MAQSVSILSTLFGVGAIGALLVGVSAVGRALPLGDARRGSFLLLGAGVSGLIGLGYGFAALGLGTVGTEPILVPTTPYIGWVLATTLSVIVIGRLARITVPPMGMGVGLALVGAVCYLIGIGTTARVWDVTVGDLPPTQTATVLWGAGTVFLLGFVWVLMRPFSRRASGLATQEAAIFSVLRNVVVGGYLLWIATVGLAVPLGLTQMGTIAGGLVHVLTGAAFSGILVVQYTGIETAE